MVCVFYKIFFFFYILNFDYHTIKNIKKIDVGDSVVLVPTQQVVRIVVLLYANTAYQNFLKSYCLPKDKKRKILFTKKKEGHNKFHYSRLISYY